MFLKLYILSCKIRPNEFIDRDIFTLVMKKVKLKKKTKDFDQETAINQTTSKDLGYLQTPTSKGETPF